jgi:tripartite-type tricarboxylate transporter receptor subunit TctC
MDGGGGRKATNHIFGGARPDGLTIGNVGAGLVANAVLREPGVQYDLDKLIYLGSPNSASHYVLVTKKELGLNSLEKLRAYPGLRIGALSVGHDLYINARLFAWILGLKEPKFITGYSGPELDVALLNREVDARTQTASTVIRRNRDWIEKNVVEFHAAIEIPRGYKDPAFAHLPELESFAQSEKERKVLGMFRTIRLAGSPYILPPGVPKDRAEILQEAFGKTFRDPEFLKQYQKQVAEEPSPVSPEEMQSYVRELPRDPAIVETFKQIAGPGLLPPR